MLKSEFKPVAHSLTPEEWQKALLQGQADAIAAQINLFQWVNPQTGEMTLTGPNSVTVILKKL